MTTVAEGVRFIPGQDEFIPDSHTYVVGHPSSHDLSLIDPGLVGKGRYKMDALLKMGIEPESIRRVIATHTHLDHIGCMTEILQEIRSCVHERYRMATTLGFGPRYLHSTGQLHKGGPNTGVFLQLVDEPDTDIEVPRRGYTFGNLISAQALGDYKALSDGGRRVLGINVGTDVERGLEILLTVIGTAAG